MKQIAHRTQRGRAGKGDVGAEQEKVIYFPRSYFQFLRQNPDLFAYLKKYPILILV